jgi:hypothetical protein
MYEWLLIIRLSTYDTEQTLLEKFSTVQACKEASKLVHKVQRTPSTYLDTKAVCLKVLKNS